MYPLLSSEKLTEMRRNNENSLGANRNITNQVKKSVEEGRPFTFENPRHDLYSSNFTDGFIVACPHGFVMTHSQMPFYYRGQIKDYGTCYSSLFRKINKYSNDEKARKIFLNQLRISELNCLINKFTQVKEWPFGTVFTYAIAQHYGFDTDIIDCTNDLDVALFFACCKHIGNNRYLPLDEEDIKSNKYGLLFQRGIILDLLPMNNSWPIVLPIGYQPFTRCNRQRGYFVLTKFGENIQAKNYFNIYRFEHSIELSNELYNKYDGGKKLFNYDALDEVSDLLEIIKNAKTFSNESFEDTYNHLHGNFTKAEWIENLRENEKVAIGKASYELSKERIEAINKKWSVDKFIDDEGIVPVTRKIYYD